MALNEQDKSWIREIIQNSHKLHGWGNLTKFIKEWGGFGAAVSIALFALTQWTAYVEFRTKANAAMESTDKRLTAIEGQLARQSLVSHASLSPAAFKTGLPELSSDIATVREQKLKVSTDTLDGLQQKLVATDKMAAGYWPVAAELISYESPRLDTKLPDCVDTTPEQLSWVPAKQDNGRWVPDQNPAKSGPPPPHQFTLKSCNLKLDASIPASHFSPIGPPDSFTIVCDHCIVTYSGGPIPLIDLKGYVNLIFDKCTFVFDASDKSPTKGKNLIEAVLLSSNKEYVSYTYSSD